MTGGEEPGRGSSGKRASTRTAEQTAESDVLVTLPDP